MEYVVLSLGFLVKSVWGTTCVVTYNTDYHVGSVGTAPMCLFEIVDARLSRYWEARDVSHVTGLGEGSISLEPREFFAPYFFDDLSERRPETVREYERIFDLLTEEFESPAEG